MKNIIGSLDKTEIQILKYYSNVKFNEIGMYTFPHCWEYILKYLG